MLKHLHLKLFIVPFIFVVSIGFSQNQETDTISGKFANLKEDTSKVIKIYKTGVGLIGSDPEKALIYFDEALKLSVKINYTKGIAKTFYYKGLVNKNLGNYALAEDYYNKSLLSFSILKDLKGIGQNYNGLGQVFMFQGDYTEAISYYQKSLLLSEQIKDNKDIASALNNLGLTYMNMADYENALVYYLNSLKYRELACDTPGTASCQSNIGAIYYYLGKYNIALDHYKQSYTIQQKAGNKKDAAETLNKIGAVYPVFRTFSGHHPKPLILLKSYLFLGVPRFSRYVCPEETQLIRKHVNSAYQQDLWQI